VVLPGALFLKSEKDVSDWWSRIYRQSYRG
jgi:hypothetical protein